MHSPSFVSAARRTEVAFETARVVCPCCGAAARYDPESRELPPSVVSAASDGTVELLDCVVCGLTVWGSQIGDAAFRTG